MKNSTVLHPLFMHLKCSWHNDLAIISLAGLLTWSCQSPTTQFSLKNECLETLGLLSNSLVEMQISSALSPDAGALDCPEHQLLHTRAAEAVFPFAVMYKHSGDESYLKSAVNVGNWLIKQQQPGGEWIETPWEWTGTTADQLLMMVSALPIISSALTADERESWELSIKNAADYLVREMSPDFASINYCPTTAAALAITNEVFPARRYADKAKQLARWTVAKMDEAGFITGEAARALGVKYGVDIGYEMDMSLWGLGLYARTTGDTFVDDQVRQSLEKNLEFVYPDGSLDAGWGARCYKWTTYGSKTADGCQITFSLYAQEDDRFRTAAIRNLEYLRGMINEGLIGNGPHFTRLFDTPPCNYPTFARAKNLAMAIEFGEQEEGTLAELPADKTDWYRYYPTVNVTVVRSKALMATITAYQYQDLVDWGDGKYIHRPSGGSICNLWVAGHGFLQTSSQTRYVRGEQIHMPELPDSIISLTPRIEFRDDNEYFTNLYETGGRMTVGSSSRVTAIVSTTGELKNQQYFPGGVAYTWTHEISDTAIKKKVRLRYHDRKPDIRIVEPIVEELGMQFELVDSRTVLIRGGKREFEFQILTGDVEIELGRDESRYWYPFPSLKCYPIVLLVSPPEDGFIQEVVYRISVRG